jgi:hypothetical protein
MAARNYKTAQGTELPLLNLRGKEYLEVKYRLVWFREDHPDWSIETDLKSVTEVSAYAKATIRDDTGRIIATSHKFENVQGFPDFIEKAETGAIGRALALIGYGTQFCADELDEGKRIVDAPAAPAARQSRAGRESLRSVSGTLLPQNESRTGEEPSVAVSTVKEESSSRRSVDPGDFTINFGRKYKGRKLKEIPQDEISSYIDWLENSDLRPNTPLAEQLQFLKTAYSRLYTETPAAH